MKALKDSGDKMDGKPELAMVTHIGWNEEYENRLHFGRCSSGSITYSGITFGGNTAVIDKDAHICFKNMNEFVRHHEAAVAMEISAVLRQGMLR